MSWNVTLGPLPYQEMANAVLDAVIPESQGPDSHERQVQLRAAKQAAFDILHRMNTDPGTKFYVYLSGHYGKPQGWTPAENIGVTVSTVQERIEEPKHD